MQPGSPVPLLSSQPCGRGEGPRLISERSATARFSGDDVAERGDVVTRFDWSLLRRFTPNLRERQITSRVSESRARQTSTKGGSIDSDVNALTVAPAGCVPFSDVTTETGATADAITSLNAACSDRSAVNIIPFWDIPSSNAHSAGCATQLSSQLIGAVAQSSVGARHTTRLCATPDSEGKSP